MNAKQLTKIHGTSLIGQQIETEAIGEYPGGVATVTELASDTGAPEIVFTVRHPTFGEIGVFEWEPVALIPNGAASRRDEETETKPEGSLVAETGWSSPSRKETMTTTEPDHITLYYREGASDKVYQCRVEPAGERFVVTFAYGRRESTLNVGTKTNVPVDYDAARRIFDKLVREKTAKGYAPGPDGVSYQQTGAASRETSVAPQLLNPIDEAEVERLITDDAWAMQEKFDGRRVLLRKQGAGIDGLNRRGIPVGLPGTVVQAAQAIPGNFVLDCEAMDETFHSFDLLELNGEDLRPAAYRRRLTGLLNLLMSGHQRRIQYATTAFDAKQKASLLEDLRFQKREGVVFKRLDAPYTAGRPSSGGPQLKHKFYATLSAVVGKLNPQRSVELMLRNEGEWVAAGNVTIPANHRVPVTGAVVEVRYLYGFRESGCLYQPVYLGSRTDVSDRECTVAQVKFKSAGGEEES